MKQPGLAVVPIGVYSYPPDVEPGSALRSYQLRRPGHPEDDFVAGVELGPILRRTTKLADKLRSIIIPFD